MTWATLLSSHTPQCCSATDSCFWLMEFPLLWLDNQLCLHFDWHLAAFSWRCRYSSTTYSSYSAHQTWCQLITEGSLICYSWDLGSLAGEVAVSHHLSTYPDGCSQSSSVCGHSPVSWIPECCWFQWWPYWAWEGQLGPSYLLVTDSCRRRREESFQSHLWPWIPQSDQEEVE